MFDGLYLFEWVLMALGVILFIVLVIAFFYQLTHNRSVGVLLAFFLVPHCHDWLSQPAEHSDQ